MNESAPTLAAQAANDTVSLRFSRQDLELFRDASGDRNPLHLSSEYASRTPYGQKVVFGALGAIACLGKLPLAGKPHIASLTADFLRPMFLDVDYTLKTAENGNTLSVRLFDGSVPLLSLTVVLSAGQEMAGEDEPASEDSEFPTADAQLRSEAEISPGASVSGRYRCNGLALMALCRRWGVRAGTLVPGALLWSSYLIGMELPGKSALFSRLVLRFEAAANPEFHFRYQARVRTFNAGLSQLRIDVALTSDRGPLASGECTAFVRSQLSPVSTQDLCAVSEQSSALAGKRALVIGASRGLGAALAGLLSLHGAETLSVARSAAGAEQGDAADVEWLLSLRRKMEQGGGLDFLLCNAFPPLLPLRLEPNAFRRISDYVSHATNLVLAPLCAFLEMLNRSGGCAVIVSSVAVEQPVREWPHYIAAKNAVEAFAQVAALQYPRISVLIVRPERLLTEMTNTPMGRQNALPPERFAATIVERLQQPLIPGAVEILKSPAKP
jgi:NAD(P)-dependent dehydrogenase (short-subunit alcohol dehydrogenase family)